MFAFSSSIGVVALVVVSLVDLLQSIFHAKSNSETATWDVVGFYCYRFFVVVIIQFWLGVWRA